LDSYLLLVGSATYYLSNLQGSANVLVSKLAAEDFQKCPYTSPTEFMR
jgi:hypothetical protein